MKPLTLLIKPSAGLCNMKCRYCFYRSASEGRENKIMSTGTVDLLIRRISEFRPSALTIMFQGGEPLLAGLDFYRNFTRAVGNSIRANVSYALQTNGLLIDDDYAAFFAENKFLLGVSLDGKRETNDRYRVDSGGEGVFDRVMNSIEILRRHNVDFNILSVVDDENARDIEKTYAFFRECGFSYIQFIPCVGEENGVSLFPASYEYFLKKSFDLWHEDYMRSEYVSVRHIDNYIGILLGNPPENCAMCGICGSYFVVESNGDIYPCDFYCIDEYRLGSLSDERPFDLGEKHRSFIEESRIIHSSCADCRYHFLCRGGCRADRINGLTRNRYCKAYYNFFEYAYERMSDISGSLK